MFFGFKLWTLAFAALAVVGVLAGAFIWYRVQIHQAYERGIMVERMEWTKRVVESGRAREKERAVAEKELADISTELVEAEDRSADAARKRNEAIAEAIRTLNGPIILPDAFLKPIREIGR